MSCVAGNSGRILCKILCKKREFTLCQCVLIEVEDISCLIVCVGILRVVYSNATQLCGVMYYFFVVLFSVSH